MAVDRSRTARALTDTPRGAAMGTWGLWLTVIVLGMLVAGFAAAAFYLETVQPAWPPENLAVPPRGRAALAVLATVVAAATVTWSLARLRTGHRRVAALALAWSGAALLGSGAALVADLGRVPFRWAEHAYASVYWVLTAVALLFVAIAILFVASILVQMVTGVVDEDRHLELTNTVIFVWFTSGCTVVLLALVHLLPAVGG